MGLIKCWLESHIVQKINSFILSSNKCPFSEHLGSYVLETQDSRKQCYRSQQQQINYSEKTPRSTQLLYTGREKWSAWLVKSMRAEHNTLQSRVTERAWENKRDKQGQTDKDLCRGSRVVCQVMLFLSFARLACYQRVGSGGQLTTDDHVLTSSTSNQIMWWHWPQNHSHRDVFLLRQHKSTPWNL